MVKAEPTQLEGQRQPARSLELASQDKTAPGRRLGAPQVLRRCRFPYVNMECGLESIATASSAGLWPASPTQTPRTARPFPRLSLASPFELLPCGLFSAPPGAPSLAAGWLGVQQVGCRGGGWEVSSSVRMQSSCPGRQSRLCMRGPPCPTSHSQQIEPRTYHLASWPPPSVFCDHQHTGTL